MEMIFNTGQEPKVFVHALVGRRQTGVGGSVVALKAVSCEEGGDEKT